MSDCVLLIIFYLLKKKTYDQIIEPRARARQYLYIGITIKLQYYAKSSKEKTCYKDLR